MIEPSHFKGLARMANSQKASSLAICQSPSATCLPQRSLASHRNMTSMQGEVPPSLHAQQELARL